MSSASDLAAAALRLVAGALAPDHARVLDLLPPEAAAAGAATVAARGLPVLAWLDRLEAPERPEARAVAALLQREAPALTWRRTYAAAGAPAAFLERYGWTELVGPDGPVACARARLGCLLLGPGTLYPTHAHAAEELYLVVSGTAAWRSGSGRWRERPPGALLHHPPWTPHATRTAEGPLLALYVWWGEGLREAATLGAGRRGGARRLRSPPRTGA